MFIEHYKNHFLHYQWVLAMIIFFVADATRAFSVAWSLVPVAWTLLFILYWFIRAIRS